MEKKSSITRRQFESLLEEHVLPTCWWLLNWSHCRRGKGILKVPVFHIVFLSVKTESTLYYNNALKIRSQFSRQHSSHARTRVSFVFIKDIRGRHMTRNHQNFEVMAICWPNTALFTYHGKFRQWHTFEETSAVMTWGASIIIYLWRIPNLSAIKLG